MNLTKNQLHSLQNELMSIKKTQKQITDALPKFVGGYIDFQLEDSMDASTLFSVHKLADRKREIEQILECADIIKPTANAFIQIGSSFEVDFGDGSEQFTLVETLNGIEQYQDTISINCEFGKSILGKGEQEHFSYQTPSGKIEGIITKVYSAKTKGRCKQ